MKRPLMKRKPKRKYVTTPASQARICWNNVRALCANPTHPGYRYVGARGVVMHQPWADSFEAFVEGVAAFAAVPQRDAVVAQRARGHRDRSGVPVDLHRGELVG